MLTITKDRSYIVKRAYELLEITPPNIDIEEVMKILRRMSIEDERSLASNYYHRLKILLDITYVLGFGPKHAKCIVTAVSDTIDFLIEEGFLFPA